MDNEKIGLFISELRKSRLMTQKDLAAKLNVTDKAVSKWERGLSCPDISLLAPLSDILGVTTGELLNGVRCDTQTAYVEESIVNVLHYADKAVKTNAASIQNISSIVFSGLLLVGILTCAIVDLSIFGTLTWSLIPITACVFAWCSFIPTIKYGIRGTAISLIMFSGLIVPFLFILNILVDSGGLLLPIGIRMSVIGIVYLWIVFGLFKLLRARKLIALAISLLLGTFFSHLINLVLSRIIYTTLFDVWDAMSFLIIAAVTIALFFLESVDIN
ncbi:MAG: helix-turn-helix domain-containing protein [Oscillospiraceae bacterium]|nr:helix-turn-helix domain-containing protein [Oscillospiraceae bacterium]